MISSGAIDPLGPAKRAPRARTRHWPRNGERLGGKQRLRGSATKEQSASAAPPAAQPETQVTQPEAGTVRS